MNNSELIEINAVTPRIEKLAFTHPITWSIKKDENWAIIGSNGAGKTLLIDILTGKHALKSGSVKTLNNERISSIIKSVAFSDIYSIIDTQNSYYQQRWNTSCEAEAPLVKSLFEKGEKAWVDKLVSAFGIEDLINKEINLLSSGELRKTLIVRSLLSKPRILVLDNPFIGLDTKSRISLNDLFKNLSDLDGIQIVLVVSDPRDIPDTITHVLPIKNKTLHEPLSREQFIVDKDIINNLFEKNDTIVLNDIVDSISNDNISFEDALIFKNIHIKYGNRSIFAQQ